MSDEFKIGLGVEVDTSDVQKQLDKKRDVTIDVNAKVKTDDINKKIQDAYKQIKQATEDISSKGLDKYFRVSPEASNKFKAEIKDLTSKLLEMQGKITDIKINTGTSYDNDAQANVEKLKNAIVTYKNELDQVITKTYKWKQIDTELDKKGDGHPVYGWVEALSAYSSKLSETVVKVDTFVQRQKQVSATLENNLNQIYSKGIDQTSARPIKDEGNLSNLKNQYDTTISSIERLRVATKDTFTDSKIEVDKNIAALKILISQLQNAENMATSLRSKDFQTVKGMEVNRLDEFINKAKQTKIPIAEIDNIASSLRVKLDSAFDKESLVEYLNELDLAKTKISSLKVEYGNLAKASQDATNLALKKEGLSNSIKAFLKENTALNRPIKEAKELKQRILDIQQAIGQADKAKLDNLSKEFTNANKEAKALGLTGRSLGGELLNNFKKFTSWVGISALFFGVQRVIKDMINDVKELDKQLVELSKVSDLTAKGLKDITDEAYALGQQLGKTGVNVLSAVTSFKRAGYDIKESMLLAENALKMTNVAEGITDAGVAADNLIRILKGMGKESDFSAKILDSLNQVSNTSAINFDNLADGAVRLSAVANQAGVSFDQMLGILTGGYEVLGDISKVASGSITIFSRLQAIQLEGEETVSTSAKLQEKFANATKGAVNIIDKETGQLRNVYDILNDLSDVWSTLDKNTKEALAIEAAGIRQKSTFLSILSNWQSVEKAVESSINSMNSADIENRKFLESIAGRTELLSSQFQQLSQAMINTDSVKSTITAFTEILKVFTDITKAVGGLVPIVGILVAGFATFKIIVPVFTAMSFGAASLTAGLTTATVAQQGLNAAMASFQALHPAGQILLVVSALAALVSLGNGLGSLTKSLGELQQSYAETKEELNSVNSELQTTIKRIDELLSKDTLTLIEKDELSKLKITNEELKLQKQLLEDIANEKAKEANKALEISYKTEYGSFVDRETGNKEDLDIQRLVGGTTKTEIYTNALKRYKELHELSSQRTKDQQKEYEQLKKYTTLVAGDIQENYLDKFIGTPEEQAETIQNTKELVDLHHQAFSPDLWKNAKLSDVFNTVGFKETKEELVELAKAGNLDDNTISKYSNLKTELDRIGISSEELLGYIKGIVAESKNLKINNDFSESLKEANIEVKTFNDNIKSLESAYKTLNDEEKISVENILVLIEKFPDYAKELVKINDNREDGLTLIKKLYDLEKETTLDSLELVKAKIKAENALYIAKKRNEDVKGFSDSSKVNIFESRQADGEQYENLDVFKKEAEDAIKYIEDLQNLLNGVSVADSVAKSKSGSSSSKDVWKDAFQAEYNYLKYQRERDLINAQQYYDKLNALNQKYFANRKQYAEDYRQYDLELYKLDQEIAEKRIKDWEHNLTLKINAEGLEKTKDEQVKVYTQIQNELHRLAEEARKRGLDENSEYIKNLQNQWWQYLGKIKDLNEQAYESQISNYENQISALEKLHDMAMTMEKKRLQLERDSHKERINAIKSEFDVRKSLLDNELSDYDYEKTVGSKVDEINKIQNQINLIRNDETQKGRLKQLENDLKNALDDLNDYQYRHGIDVQKKILDEKEQEAIKDSENQIDIIEKQLDDEVYLRKLADDLIKKSGKELYKQLIDFAQKYGDFSVQEVKDVWKEYESFATNLDVSQNGVISTLDTLYGKLSAIKDLLKAMSEMSLGEFGSSQTADGIISQMQQNSKDWHTSNNKSALEQDNINLAAKLKELFGIEIEKRKDGYWYYKGTEKRVYHEGGFVDDKFGSNYKSVSKLKSDEVEAILQKGELVISKGGVSNLIENINNLSAIASKLNAFDIPKFNNLEFAGRGQGFTFEDNGVYNLNGIDDASLSKFKIAKREMIDEAISKFNSLIKNNGSNSVNIKNRY